MVLVDISLGSMALLLLMTVAAVATISVATVAFIAFHQLKRYDGVDSIWGLLSIAAIYSTMLVSLSGSPEPYQLLAASMVTIWGLRLSYHIFRRFLRSNHEDPRYTELRSNWPQRYLGVQVYIRIYLVQALLSVIISLPAILLVSYMGEITPVWIYAGAVVWVAGFITEVVADRQLKAFMLSPHDKGALMTKGLWGRSRHPNYFGEILLWWGVGICALAIPYGWVCLVGPLTITLLITKVSGIPPSEKRMSSKKGWDSYKQSTPLLVPKL